MRVEVRVEVRERYRIKVLRKARTIIRLDGWEGTHAPQQLPKVLLGEWS